MRVLFAAVVLLLSLSYGSLKDIESSSGVGIYGGTKVAIEEVPFMAMVYERENGFWCGGAIITRQYVLTAAHCCRSTLTHVKVGTDQLHEGGQTVKIAAVHLHPKYDLRPFDRDICVLKLENKLHFSETVKPIFMVKEHFKLNEGDILDTIGFGKMENKNNSEYLLKVSLPYVPNEKCERDDVMTNTMLCAGGEKGKQTCSGDSGSALYYKNRLVGLTSFGPKDCKVVIPSVFARISALRSFVNSVITRGD